MKLFCFGLGYTAKNLISALSPTSWQFSGTSRSGNIRFDTDQPLENAREHLKDVTHLLISVPPEKTLIDPVIFHHKANIQKMTKLKWIGYLSATSIYGDHGGNWVDENTPPAQTNERGALRLEAEKQWRSLDKPVNIFRLGGIYGPERNQIKSVQNNIAKKIIKNNHSFSRIHVDDICTALIASMKNTSKGSIYNIVDDFPSSAADVLDFLCEELSLPPLDGIAYDDASLSPALRSFYQDNKRVRNEHAKSDLNWQPKFTNYKQGYIDILRKLGDR